MPEPVDNNSSGTNASDGKAPNEPKAEQPQDAPPAAKDAIVVRPPRGNVVNVTGMESRDALHAIAGMPEQNETGEHPSALQPWIDADRRGNSLWPQTGTGILLHVADSVAESIGQNGVDWAKFTTSELTDKQIDELGTVLNGLHEHFNVAIVVNGQSIPLRYKQEGQPGEFFIGPANIRELWRRERYGVATLAYTFMNRVLTAKDGTEREDITPPAFTEVEGTNGFPYHAISEISPEDTARLQAFFTDPQHASEIQLFKQLLASSVATMSTPQGQELARDYRDTIAFRTQEEIRSNPNLRGLKGQYLDELRRLITGSAVRAFAGIPADAIVDFFRDAFSAGAHIAPGRESEA